MANSLIVLYGDVDYELFLQFLDTNYLSAASYEPVDLAPYTNQPVPEGFVKKNLPIPAYEGTSAEQASLISYAFDLSALPEDAVMDISFLTSLFTDINSPIIQKLEASNLPTDMVANVYIDTLKPFLSFKLTAVSEDVADQFKIAVDAGLQELAAKGAHEDLRQTLASAIQMQEALLLETGTTGLDVSYSLLLQWKYSGQTDISCASLKH